MELYMAVDISYTGLLSKVSLRDFQPFKPCGVVLWFGEGYAGTKAFAVQLTQSVFTDSGDVRCGAVAFVYRKAVAWESFVLAYHDVIPRHFCADRS